MLRRALTAVTIVSISAILAAPVSGWFAEEAPSWPAPPAASAGISRVLPLPGDGVTLVRAAFTGRVVDPDGLPALGAVVVSSAGGQAVTGSDGTFVLEVDLPPGSASVQVTAVSSGPGNSATQTTSVRATAPAGPGTVTLADLSLATNTGCTPNWLPTFGGQPGVDNQVFALAVYDDGAGPALHAGGNFSSAGGVPAKFLAKWDGTSWSSLGSGTNSSVGALSVFDDGSGAALYAGGFFITAGGVTVNNIASWDGASWSALRGGLGGQWGDTVNALVPPGVPPALPGRQA